MKHKIISNTKIMDFIILLHKSLIFFCKSNLPGISLLSEKQVFIFSHGNYFNLDLVSFWCMPAHTLTKACL